MATVTVNGVELYYERQGAGEPVVLVHGGYGDANAWFLLAPELAVDHDVVAYDQRGHTRSERPPGPLSMDDLVADLAGLIERLDLAPVHLVGNSMGGTVALRLAVGSPELIRTLAVHEPALFALLACDPATASYAVARAEQQRRMAEVLEHDPIAAIESFIDRITPGASAFVPDDAKKQRADNASYYFRGEPMASDADLDALARAAVPILLTEGDQTPEETGLPAVVRIVGDALPRARRVTIEGAGHSPAFTHAAEYGRLLRDFFAEAS